MKKILIIGCSLLLFTFNLQPSLCPPILVGGTSNCFSAENGLVAHWSFDEGKGGIAKDSSGNKNDAEICDGVWVQGISGSALQFDGNSFAECTTFSGDLSRDLTIEMWIKPVNTGKKSRVNPIDKCYSGEFAWTINANGSMSYYHGQGGGYFDWLAFPDTGTIAADKWQHIAVTRDNKKKIVKSYYNGRLVTEKSYDGFIGPSQSSSSIFISTGYAGLFAGIIDEIKIYKRALTAEEIGKSYSKNNK